jgi:hypothetical protein
MRKDRAMAEALQKQGPCGKSIRTRMQSHEPKRSTRPKAPDYFAGLRGPDGPARTANVQLDMVRVRRKTARSARPLAGDGDGVKSPRIHRGTPPDERNFTTLWMCHVKVVHSDPHPP